jgi:hypothetical protein
VRTSPGACRNHQITAEHQIGFAGRNAYGANRILASSDPQMRPYRAAFLSKSGHVEHPAALALEMCGHTDKRANRDHAGPAHPGDHN